MEKKFEQFRPENFIGSGDKHLYPLIKELSKVIYKLEKRYSYDIINSPCNFSIIIKKLAINV